MIFMDFQRWSSDVGDLEAAYAALPKHIAKKHLLASMRSAIRMSRGVQILKSYTPKAKTRTVRADAKRDERGRHVAGSQGWEKLKGGALRRAVTVNARYIGRNSDGVAVAVLGYKWGRESKKAIWLEKGTLKMQGRHMVQRAMSAIGPSVRHHLGKALAAALSSARKEELGGKNPGWSGKK
jgi:hypothetical protein